MKFIQEKIVVACGVLLVILPLTGFPRSWKSVISVFVGVVVIYVGALLYRKALNAKSERVENKTKAFTEII